MHLMSRKREPMDCAILGLLLLGIGMALVQFFFNRSAWFDEAMLGISIVGRGFGGLLQWPHAKSFRVSRSRPQVPARISSI